MDTTRRERKRLDQLDQMATAAWSLFEQHGFDTVTMEQIALAADVAKGTLYNHFSSKEALLAHHFHRQLAQDAQRLRGDFAAQRGIAAQLRFYLRTSAGWMAGHRGYLPHYLRHRFVNLGSGERSGTDDLLLAVFDHACAAGELRADVPPARLMSLFRFMTLSTTMQWLLTPDLDLTTEYERMLDVFLHGAGDQT
ncbi:TetR/AcrR family transcriptional regulator [Massilia arenosa]|uniref:TetR/AcrR family transcriptional regulator n=1 Tax=Zemynaea arenosa TaxID=2561931 RepID=A0A4Y9SAG8_9BURK|nr:TetR/AcrR family transcriptional regulator [Massilia arenosa]TFW17159.1 TetR/AcrR family transcriptional regulator [Massilia arenosa]